MYKECLGRQLSLPTGPSPLQGMPDQSFLLSEITPFLLLLLPLGRSGEEQNPGAGTGTHDGMVTGQGRAESWTETWEEVSAE